MEIRFTRSARRHRISRTDARAALLAGDAVRPGKARPDGTPVLLVVGVDTRGRRLEVGIVVEGDVVTVIHAMPSEWRKS